MSTLARVIAEAIREQEWTQSQAARAVEVADSTITRLVADGFIPGEAVVARMAEVFGLDGDELRILAGLGCKPASDRYALAMVRRENQELRIENSELRRKTEAGDAADKVRSEPSNGKG